MAIIIGVRFRPAGKIYYFDPVDTEAKIDDNVIVETARGVEYGKVVLGPVDMDESKIVQPLKPIIRRATKEDTEREEKNRAKEEDAFKICLEKIRKHELEMKLIECKYTFDNNKVLFYFTADGRIDFRELVKDLAAVFKTRIELRQIGVRDEAKALGGIGVCGRPLCCNSCLMDFAPVSIKMAKEQNLSLNPTKISGSCGRLMCCLSYEECAYEELNSHLPGIGDHVTTSDGAQGEVNSVNVLKQTVRVVITDANGDKEAKTYKASEITFHSKKRKDRQDDANSESSKEMNELKALEMLEKRDAKSKFDD